MQAGDAAGSPVDAVHRARLTYLRPDGGIASRLEFHGTVESAGEDAVEVRRADNGEIFTLPPAPEAYEPAHRANTA